ncbi:MAG TPA: hypothetical protein VH392_07335 [Sphingomicrobium sp.]
MPARKYRIGLIVDDLQVPKWVYDLAEWARNDAAMELAAIVVVPPKGRAWSNSLLKLENRLLSAKAEYRPYAAPKSIAGYAPTEILLAGFEVDPDELRQVEELELDVLVRCGRAMPKGAILNVPADGIISVRTTAEGGTSAFAEVVEGRPDTPFTIERLHEEREPREVLFEGSVATALFYVWNLVVLYSRAYRYLRLVLERLSSGNAHRIDTEDSSGKPARVTDVLAYGIRTARRSLGKGLRVRSGAEFNWQVAVARQAWSDCRFETGSIIPNPPGAFLADPFTINVDGIDYLFVEEFGFDNRKGVISAYRIGEHEAERIGVVLEEPYHLSFPFVFRHGGDIYMVPESTSDRSIRLYKSTAFPGGWSEVKVLMSDVPAVDTVIFEHDSLWWMLTTIQGAGPGLNHAELCAFYASDPLGDWTPHKQNPVVMNALKGRNGGFVRDSDGTPCRVAQVPGFTFYGAASEVYRIEELTPETYRERLVRRVQPDFFPNLDGTHHISSADGLTVYDFMRVERPLARKGGKNPAVAGPVAAA